MKDETPACITPSKPSRYPLFNVLPDAMPDRETCEKCVRIARRVGESARSALKDKADKVGNNT